MTSLLGEVKSLGKQSLIYGTGLWATGAAGFVLVPLYVRRLSPADYGVLEILNRTSGILTSFALAGMVLAVLRFYHLYESAEERRRVVSGAVAFVLVSSVVIQVLVTLFSRDVSRLLLGSPDYALLCVLAGLRMIADIGFLLPGTLLRVREQVVLYTGFSVAKFALSIGFNIWFVVGLNRGLIGVMQANVLSGGIVALVVTAYCVRAVGLKVSGGILKPMLAFGLPIAAGGIPAIITGNLDRYMLLNVKSAGELGMYALATRFGTLLSLMLFQPFVFVYSAFMFKIAKRPDAPEVYGKVMTGMTAIAVWLTVLLASFSQDIVAMLRPDRAYALSGAVAPVLLVGYLLWGISPQLEVGIYLRKKTVWKPAIFSVQAGVFALLCFGLIPRWGAIGAAWAYVGSQAVLCVCLYLVARRLFRVSYEWARLGVLTGALGVGVALAVWLGGLGTPLGLAGRVLLVAAVGLVVALAALLRPSTLERLPLACSAVRLGARTVSDRAAASGCLAASFVLTRAWALNRGAVIVRYHSISDPKDPENPLPPAICTSPAVFEAQMEALAAETTPTSLDAVMEAFERGDRLPPRAVVVTLDDGYADNENAALPILQRHGIPATFFATTGWIGQDADPWFVAIRRAFLTTRRPSWRSPVAPCEEFFLDCQENRHAARRAATRILARLSLSEQQAWIAGLYEELEVEPAVRQAPLMMSWDQVANLQEAGMTVGAHTVCHPNLAWLPVERQEAEIRDSKLALEAHLKSPARYLAYPDPIGRPGTYPAFTEESVELSRKVGFRAALTTLPGVARVGTNRFSLPRVGPPSVDGGLPGFSGCFLSAALKTARP